MTTLKRRVLCGLLGVLFVASSIVSFTGYSASAASEYDDWYNLENPLQMQRQNYYGSQNCSATIGSEWSSYLTNPENWSNTNSDLNEQARQEFNQAVSNGRMWGASKSRSPAPGNGYQDTMTIFYNNNENNTDLIWTGGEVFAPNTGYVQVSFNDSCELKLLNSSPSSVGIYQVVVSNLQFYATPIVNLLVSGYNANYPPGYDGTPINETIVNKIRITPEFSYDVSDRKLKARIIGELPFRERLQIRWSLQNADNNSQIIETKVISPDGLYEAEVPSKGQWLLYATPINPVPNLPIPDEYSLHSKIQVINFDGSSFSSDTTKSDCANNGDFNFCQEYSIYNDCSEFAGVAPYGIGGGSFPDIIGGFGCQLQNFGIFITTTLKFLFVPSDNFINNQLSQFGDWLEEKFGFIADAFTFVIELLRTTLQINPQPVLTIPGNPEFFGATIRVDFSQMQQSAPVVWNIMMTLVRSAILVGILFAANHRFWGVIKGLGR